MGLIPAHAGKTPPLPATSRRARAHPRSRGENMRAARRARSRSGSSPLTRGKPHRPPRPANPCGLIPAHAGKTQAGRQAWARRPAHPRSRGENLEKCETQPTQPGSSPLTRGKLSAWANAEVLYGLIPAHAGKTFVVGLCAFAHRAHPRSRGENCSSSASALSPGGSSPLTLGKHFLTCAFIAQIGQILESLELCASSESYSSPEAYATDALQGRVRSIDLGLRSSRGAS